MLKIENIIPNINDTFNLSLIIKNAKSAALRADYDMYVYKDGDDGYAFSQTKSSIWDDCTLLGIAKVFWENGIKKVKYLKVDSTQKIDEDLEKDLSVAFDLLDMYLEKINEKENLKKFTEMWENGAGSKDFYNFAKSIGFKGTYSKYVENQEKNGGQIFYCESIEEAIQLFTDILLGAY